jgi:tetratricopeptide (TPR) repeat protein
MKVAAGLIVAGVLLFGASLTHPFHFDDALITNDSNVTNPTRWAHFFNPFHLRQFTFFTFYLNYIVGGPDPAGFHAVNVALHIANAVLLYLLLKRFATPWVAAVAAALFLAHPIQTEPVLYVYQRSILLACFFSLLGLIALADKRPWLTAALFFLAFESKESALAIPVAVALLAPLARSKQEGSSRPRLFYFYAFGAALGAFALFLLASDTTVGIGAGMNPLRYLLTETRVLFTYLRLLVFPLPQSLEYEFGAAGSVWTATGIALILGAVLAFFVLLAPTSSIIPSADAAFEHRLYLPMLAFCVFAAQLLAKLSRKTWLTAAALIVLSGLTVRREMVWSSDVSLWEDAVQHAPGKARAWFNLGGADLSKNPEKARSSFLRALELQPHFPEALYDLGLIEQQKQNWIAAIGYYQRALDQDPDYWQALNNMGNTIFAMGQPDRALGFFERTLRLNPDYWPAQYNIAVVHFTNGQYTEAAARLRTVLDWRPAFRQARYLLAVSLTRAGDRAAADREWKQLGELNAAESRLTPTMILAPNRP